ncbi:hypothetical protein AALO_G00197020 [Alosa alosa]|uniref:Uncharacterized protein n=1 Tax=Alosa alosa TaxID=278164 RepID=A0AAV6G1I1_9TELE|nr:hypothetical protein AALO_G00197020 [Alosa alosa]
MDGQLWNPQKVKKAFVTRAGGSKTSMKLGLRYALWNALRMDSCGIRKGQEGFCYEGWRFQNIHEAGDKRRRLTSPRFHPPLYTVWHALAQVQFVYVIVY